MADPTRPKRDPFEILIQEQETGMDQARSMARAGREIVNSWPAMKKNLDGVAVSRLKNTLDALRQRIRAIRRKEPFAKKLAMLLREIRGADRLGNAAFLHPAILIGWLRVAGVFLAIQAARFRLWMGESRGTAWGFLIILLLFSIPIVFLLFFM